jgi:restriction system protein
MLPFLRLSAKSEVRTRDAVDRIADEFGLTPEQREEPLPSGNQSRFSNRVHWAIVYLQKAGLIQRVSRGVYRITERGKSILQSPPPRIDRQFLSQFEGMREFQQRTSRTTSERILAMPPKNFEKLIIDLMLGMGYGARGSGQHLGQTADGGVDGVINEDVLGLDLIYLQAKRYAKENRIGVEKIREFAGSLDERGATKGVFVTTSYFAQPARQYAKDSPKSLVLIGGNELTQYLIKFGVAVRLYQTIDLKKLDVEYFDEMGS